MFGKAASGCRCRRGWTGSSAAGSGRHRTRRAVVGAPGQLDGGVDAGDLFAVEKNTIKEFLGGLAVFEGDLG